MRRAVAGTLALTSGLAVALSPAAAAPTRSQTFFRGHLLDDRRTSREIKTLLREGGAFVSRAIAFKDLTGDGKSDAVVRVDTGGSAGVVALYVFSTDGPGRKTRKLRAVHRSQRLTRASAQITDGVLRYRTSTYRPGDEACCPARTVETELRWDDDDARFRAASRREVAPE